MIRFFIIFIFLFCTHIYAQNLQKVTLQLHWLDQFEFAGYYMAKEKGFYKDAGFDVKLKNYSFGMNMLEEIKKGNADFAIGGSDLLLDASKGEKLKLLASIFQSSPLVLLTTPKSNIKTLQDFKNKKIMITPDAINSVTLNAMMTKENISMADLIFQKHSFDIQDLIDGKTQLYQSYISNEPYYLQKAGIDPIIFDPKKYGFDFYSDILFTSEKNYQKNPTNIIAFKEASLKGWQYAFEHIDESVEIIYKKYNIQNKSKEALLFEAKALKKLALIDNIPLGDIQNTKLQRILDIYNLLNLIKQDVNINNLLIENQKNILPLTPEELQYIKTHPILKVSNEMDYPPYDFTQDKIPMGYSIDLMKLLAKKLGVKFEFINGYSWEELVSLFCEKKIDILHPTDKSSQIEQCASFTDAIIKDTSKFLTQKDFKKINTINDLFGFTIASPKGWEQTEIFKTKYKNTIKVIETKDTQEAIEYVVSGKADFAIDYENVMNYYILKNGITNIKVQGNWYDTYSNNNLYMASHKTNPILANILQKTFDSLKANELEELHNKWFGLPHTKQQYIDLNSNEKEYLKNNEIKMCVDPDWEPYEKINEQGEHIGVVADLLELIENRIDKKFTLIKTTSWDESLAFKKSGKCDIVSFLNQTPQRSEFLNFTDVLYDEPEVIAARNNITYINGFKGLQNKTIGIIKGYQLEEFLKTNNQDIKLVYVKNKKEGLEKISNGEIFATVNALMGGAYLINKYNLANVKIAGETGRTNQYRIGVDKNNLILLHILNKAVQSITQEEKENIVSKWLSVKLQKVVDYTSLYKIFAVLLILGIYGLYRYYQSIKINQLIQSKNKQLELANKKALSAVQAKSEFMANISHEIRTPLSGIIGLTDLLLKTQLSQIQREYLLKTKTTSDTLLGVINDILDSSKIESGKFTIHNETFGFLDLIDNIRDLFVYQAEEKNIKFYLDIDESIPPYFVGDALRIKQILNNLLSNAFKFTHKGFISLTISHTLLENQKVQLHISVKDSGIGISKENQEKIFCEYEQGDNTICKNYGGTGLGLQITKRLVELMDGKIELQSEENVGSEFIATIVLKQGEEIKQTSNKNNLQIQAFGKVLLVEDNEINQLIINETLKEYGVMVDMAHNGLEAIDLVKKNHYDLIFMDIHMPVMDGIEATKQIRLFNPNIPIVALSAAAMQKDKQRTTQQGINEHLSKPIDWNAMENILKKYLECEFVNNNTHENMENEIELDNINHKEFMKKFQSNKTTGYFILEHFAKKYKNFKTDIEQLSNEKEQFEYIHSLKGAVGNIRATEIFDLIVYLQNGAINEQKERLFEEIGTKLDILIQEIETKITPLLKTNKKQDSQDLFKELEMLIFDLEEDEFISLERFSNFLDDLENLISLKERDELRTLFESNQLKILQTHLIILHNTKGTKWKKY